MLLIFGVFADAQMKSECSQNLSVSVVTLKPELQIQRVQGLFVPKIAGSTVLERITYICAAELQ